MQGQIYLLTLHSEKKFPIINPWSFQIQLERGKPQLVLGVEGLTLPFIEDDEEAQEELLREVEQAPEDGDEEGAAFASFLNGSVKSLPDQEAEYVSSLTLLFDGMSEQPRAAYERVISRFTEGVFVEFAEDVKISMEQGRKLTERVYFFRNLSVFTVHLDLGNVLFYVKDGLILDEVAMDRSEKRRKATKKVQER